MRIDLSPQRRDDALEVLKHDDVLTINGEEFDFSNLPNGAKLPREAVECEWLASDVERIDGDIYLTLIVPHGPNPSPAVAFPAPLVNPANGKLALPRDPEPEEPGNEQD